MNPCVKLLMCGEQFVTFDQEHRERLRESIHKFDHGHSLSHYVTLEEHCAKVAPDGLAGVACACIRNGYELRIT